MIVLKTGVDVCILNGGSQGGGIFGRICGHFVCNSPSTELAELYYAVKLTVGFWSMDSLTFVTMLCVHSGNVEAV